MSCIGQSKLGGMVMMAGLALAALGCGDAANEAGSGGADGGSADTCRAQLAANQTFALPQEAGARSFQSHLYFDGEGIWIVHASVPNGLEAIVIEALRVACDGSVLTESQVVSPEGLLTHTEPRIAGYGDKVMIAWQSDTGAGPNNLSTHYRVFDRSEGPASTSSVLLDTQYKGASAGNTWMPELAAGAGGFALAGLRGVSDFSSFQSFMQRIDFSGAMVGGAVNGELQDGLWQGQADLSLDDDGNVIMAWERSEEDDSKHIVQVRIGEGASEPDSAPIRMSTEKGSQVALGGSTARGFYLVSSREAGGLLLKPADALDPNLSALTMGGANVALYPQVAANSQGGGLVAWLESTTGNNAEIHLQAFAMQGATAEALGEEHIVATDNPSIAAYRISLAHLFDSVYLVNWTEGPVSALQVKWRAVDLSTLP